MVKKAKLNNGPSRVQLRTIVFRHAPVLVTCHSSQLQDMHSVSAVCSMKPIKLVQKLGALH